jgi:hypothetical protein
MKTTSKKIGRGPKKKEDDPNKIEDNLKQKSSFNGR